jgi:hypothetical protein
MQHARSQTGRLQDCDTHSAPTHRRRRREPFVERPGGAHLESTDPVLAQDEMIAGATRGVKARRPIISFLRR